MRATLRRSCDACAKAKHSCDLRTPRCSRCLKRNCPCIYANEPLTSSPITCNLGSTYTDAVSRQNAVEEPPIHVAAVIRTPNSSSGPMVLARGNLDPFDSYPPTRLPRERVQRLIHHFLSEIAFQWYPLDLNPISNPFLVSWWPKALAEPALFHVSLQTACLDEELRAQRGFPISEILMTDSVSLVRRRIEHSSLAFQDETLNSVVTLAAIEHGKGNINVSRMHIEGIKRIVDTRGGINAVKLTSPLTAGMVSWVALLVMGAPQFDVQEGSERAGGIEAIPQWEAAVPTQATLRDFGEHLNLDQAIADVLARLRMIYHQPAISKLSTNEMHDLTGFVMHKLLLLPPFASLDEARAASSECLRHSLALYILIIRGTTYYSHYDLANIILLQLRMHLKTLSQTSHLFDSLWLWAITMALSAPVGMTNLQWAFEEACAAAQAKSLRAWRDVIGHLESILWIKTTQDSLFQQKWEMVLGQTWQGTGLSLPVSFLSDHGAR